MEATTVKKDTQKIISWLNEQHPDISIVMYDVGSRYGIHYLYTDLLKLNKFTVVGFEPDNDEVNKLTSSKKSGMKNIFPVALAESEGERTLYITRNPGCSSLFPPNTEILQNFSASDLFEVVDTQSVKTISLDTFTKQYEVALPDFIKLDIQGAEYEVLKGGASTLDNVVGIFLETQLRELYLGAPLFTDIHTLLIDLGFRLISCEYNPYLGGEIVELDVAYVRDTNYLKKEEDLLKAFVFSLIHSNVDFAANLIRFSSLTESRKREILELISQPLGQEKLNTDSNSPYVTGKVELRKIYEDWWDKEPTS